MSTKSFKQNGNSQRGQSLIEILVAMGLMAILLPALLTGLVASREAKPQKANRQAALLLAREAEEAVRSTRQGGWGTFPVAGTYYPQISGNAWTLPSGTETVGNFTRSITIEDLYRELSGNIATSGGTLDPSTKKATINVSWTEPINSSIESVIYLTRYLNNVVWTQTTQTEFTLGTNVNVSIVNNNGGEIILTPSSGGSWTSPAEIDTYNASGPIDGGAIFTQGNYLFLGTDAIYIIDISDPFNLTMVGTYDTGNATVFDIYVEGDYAYLATGSNTKEIMVVDVSDKTNPSTADTLNLNKNNDAYGIFKLGNYVYATRDKTKNEEEFLVIDVSDPTNISIEGSLERGTDVNDVFVVGNYAYTTTDDEELQIIDISTPTNPSLAATYNAPSGANGEGVFVEGDYAYLVTGQNGSGDELYIVDISSPTSPSLTGSFDVGANTNSVYVTGGYAFVASENTSAEFQVIDATDPSSPTLYGSYSVSSGTNKIYVSGNYAYLGMDDNTRELIVIEGGFGTGGGDYQESGDYISQTFDAGTEVAFNHIDFTITEVTGSNINFQIATNNDNTTWNFVGPDGSNGTYFETPGGFPLNYVLGQYLKFKAYLTGDGDDTPILEDVTINYSE